jgi:hypothetical protein
MSLLLLVAISSAAPRAVENTIRLRWTDPMGRVPITHEAWAEKHRPADDATRGGRVVETGKLNVVEIVVNAEIYPDLTGELTRYTSDLQAAGYSVRIDTMRGMNPVALRSLLQGISELKGALLVGELPVAWYEADWGGSSPEEFPCDLYFADLNGTWLDGDGDGLYDDHTGNVAPEIWIGRLYARPLTWDDEVRLLRHYFDKNHLYRTGGLTLPDRGLCFNDEDWAGSGDCGLTAIYPTVNVIEDARTTAPNYRTELLNGYEWIHVMAHSSAWGNTFRSSGGNYTGTVFNCEIYAFQPHANFYNLFACSGARFVEENYSAGWDVFNEDWGLFAVGSTKTGSMIGYFEDFYSPIGGGSSAGDAFKAWFIANGEYSRDWHYGLALIGDPTLKPRHGAACSSQPTAYSQEPSAVGRRPLAEVVGADIETDANPAIAVAPDSKVWVVWETGRTPANGRFDVYGAYRTVSGWSSPMAIGNAYYWECDPALGIDNAGRPVCVWSRFEDSYHYNLYYSYWTGSSWTAAARISEDPSEDMKAAMTRDGSGRLWCFWQSRRDYYPDVFACYWNGSSWSAPQNVTSDSFEDCWPTALTDQAGRAWVFYTRYGQGRNEIWGSYWSGSNWVRSGPVSGSQRRALRPACAADDSGRLWVAWQSHDGGSGEICASFSTGTTWSTPVAVSTSPALDVHPAMTCDITGKPWITWQSKQTGNWNILASYLAGGAWTSPMLVDSNSGFNLDARIACTSTGTMWIAWQNYQAGGNWEIWAENLPLTGICEPQGPNPVTGPGNPTLACSPNPAVARGGLAHLAVRYALGANETGRLVLFDRNGRLVRSLGSVTGTGTMTCRDLRAGVYFARLTTDTRQSELKLVLTE